MQKGVPKMVTLRRITSLSMIACVSASLSCFVGQGPGIQANPGGPAPVVVEDAVEEPPNGVFNLTEVTPGGLNCSAGRVLVDGRYVWVMGDLSGIQILDALNPAKPIWIGKLAINFAKDVLFSNGYAYISSGIREDSRLVVVDCDPMESAQIVGSVPLQGSSGLVYMAGSTLWIPIHHAGLTAIDATNPESPCVAKWIADERLTGAIAVGDGYAYAIAEDLGLIIYDIRETQSSYMASSVAVGVDDLSKVAYSNGYAFISESPQGIHVVDVDPPWEAHVVSTLAVVSFAMAIDDLNGYLYVAGGNGGLQVVDVRSPDSAKVLATLPNSGSTYTLAVMDRFLFAAVSPLTVRVLDVSVPDSPAMAAELELRAFPRSFAATDGFVFVTDSEKNLYAIDVRGPGPPRIVYTSEWLNDSRDVDVQGNHAFLTDGESLRIIDISTPESPVIVSTLETGFPLNRIVISDGYAWVTLVRDWGFPPTYDGVVLVDIDPISSAHVVKNISDFGPVSDIAIDGKYAYVGACEEGLRIFDISSPESPVLVKTVPSSDFYSSAYHRGFVTAVGISDDYAVVGIDDTAETEYSGCLGVVDINPPDQANLIGRTGNRIAERIRTKDGYAYVAGAMFGFLVLGIDPPNQPQLVGSLRRSPVEDSGGILLAQMLVGAPRNGVRATCLDIAGEYAYVGGQERELHVFDLSNTPSLVDVGKIEIGGELRGLDVSGHYAYVAGGRDGGLHVVKLW